MNDSKTQLIDEFPRVLTFRAIQKQPDLAFVEALVPPKSASLSTQFMHRGQPLHIDVQIVDGNAVLHVGNCEVSIEEGGNITLGKLHIQLIQRTQANGLYVALEVHRSPIFA